MDAIGAWRGSFGSKDNPRTRKDFGIKWRVLAGVFTSAILTGMIAAVSAGISGNGYVSDFAFVFGLLIGVFFVLPLYVPVVVCVEFGRATLLMFGCAAIGAFVAAGVFPPDSYPMLSLFGASVGVCVGAMLAWMFVPRYAGGIPGTCKHCGYSLEGLPENVPCPECGQEKSDPQAAL